MAENRFNNVGLATLLEHVNLFVKYFQSGKLYNIQIVGGCEVGKKLFHSERWCYTTYIGKVSA